MAREAIGFRVFEQFVTDRAPTGRGTVVSDPSQPG